MIPVIDPSADVHSTAVSIGDVHIGRNCYIGPNASLRGDFGRIVLAAGANVQDNCVMHCVPQQDSVVEENCPIGHGAVLHTCVVCRNSLVIDESLVGEAGVVTAFA